MIDYNNSTSPGRRNWITRAFSALFAQRCHICGARCTDEYDLLEHLADEHDIIEQNAAFQAWQNVRRGDDY